MQLGMLVDGKGVPHGARIENDDNDDAAVGDCIEVEGAQILQVAEG